MMEDKLYLVMDDTNNFSDEELAEFESRMDPEVLETVEARMKETTERFFGKLDEKSKLQVA